jgi:hypothetical protein
LYITLFDNDPTDANLTAQELTLGVANFARVAVLVSNATWSDPITSGGVELIANLNNITFPAPSANWNAGNPIDYAGMYDAPTGGNLIVSGILTTPRSILSTDNAPVFGPGSFVMTLA